MKGVVGKILIEAGTENVKVNAPIAVLLEDGESAGDIDVASISGAAPASAANGAAANGMTNGRGYALFRWAPLCAGASARCCAIPGGRSDLASPLAKRIAKNEGVDLSRVKGTGPHGRIVKRDVESAIKDGGGALASGAPAAFTPSPASVDARLYPPESYEAFKLDGMRKVIAKRLSQSFNQEVPHFPLNVDIELDQLLAVRKRINATSAKEGDHVFKLSVNDFIIKASAMALKAVPAANSTYTDEAILYHKHADIGVAVAIEWRAINAYCLAGRGKRPETDFCRNQRYGVPRESRKLKPEEYQGGTFSVSNLGMFGIKSFASIVNQPHGAIMSVGAGEERVVVKNGEMVIATVMTVTLTCDHRVVDGAVGAEFLTAFKGYLEEPASMLL